MAGNAEAAIRGKLVYRDEKISLYFDLSYTGIQRYALSSTELGHALGDIAEAAKTYAEFISPYDPQDDPPHYINSFEISPYVERRIGKPIRPRQARLLINNNDAALFVEFGNGRDGTGHHVFDKTMDYIAGLGRTAR